MDQQEDEAVKVIFQSRRKKRKRKRRFRPRKESVKGEEVYNDLIRLFEENYLTNNADVINTVVQSARKIIPQLKKKEVAIIGKLALEEIGSDKRIPRRVLHVIIDLTKSKLQDNQERKKAMKPHKEILPFIVRYKNHGVGMIDMRTILRKKKVCDAVPSNLIKKEDPMVVYRYEPTIRNKIFNYKQTAEEYTPRIEENMTCLCEDSVYKDSNHVIMDITLQVI